MHKRGLCYHAVSVHLSAIMLCLSVCLSLSSIVSKRVNVSSKFFLPSASHHSSFLIPDVMAVFRWGRPLTRAKIVIFNQYLALGSMTAGASSVVNISTMK